MDQVWITTPSPSDNQRLNPVLTKRGNRVGFCYMKVKRFNANKAKKRRLISPLKHELMTPTSKIPILWVKENILQVYPTINWA